MYTSLDIDHLIRERNARLLRGVRAERLRSRLQADRGRRSAASWLPALFPLRWRISEETATEEA